MITRKLALLSLSMLIWAVFTPRLTGSVGHAEVARESQYDQLAQTPAMPEYLVKSAMLYHFARFTKWPEHTFEDSDVPYRFCVIGQDPFGPDLDALIRETIRNRDIITTRLQKIRHAKNCHLLFIARSERKNLQNILDQLSGRPILTIADMESFAKNGGIIELKLVDNKIRFEINLGVAKEVDIGFRSELLLLADTISGEFERNRFDILTE